MLEQKTLVIPLQRELAQVSNVSKAFIEKRIKNCFAFVQQQFQQLLDMQCPVSCRPPIKRAIANTVTCYTVMYLVFNNTSRIVHKDTHMKRGRQLRRCVSKLVFICCLIE